MIDADTYWAAYDSLCRVGPPAAPKPTADFIAKQLPGGCVLYRLPTKGRRNTDTREDS
jgi:hypothetical protein